MTFRFSFTTEDILVWIIKFLWVFVLMPKSMQFVAYAAILLLLLWKNRINFADETFFVLAGCVVQIIAIIIQLATAHPSSSRAFAAFNTTAIWILAIAFYALSKKGTDRDRLIHRTAAAIRMNIYIMFVLYLFSLVYKSNTITMFGLRYYLRRYDYLSTGRTTRFCALMESVLGPSHLYFVSVPLLMADNSIKPSGKNLVAMLLCNICVIATHSRVGTVACTLATAIILYRTLTKRLDPNLRRIVAVMVIAVAAYFIVINRRMLGDMVLSFFNARAGSNNARFTIYSQSIKRVLEESPLVGIGIKYMIGSFPYGSHCTYIGLLYKAGIIGASFFMYGLYRIVSDIYRKAPRTPWNTSSFLVLLCYFLLLVFADIDGSDWVIVSMFITWGFMSIPPAADTVDTNTETTGEVIAVG